MAKGKQRENRKVRTKIITIDDLFFTLAMDRWIKRGKRNDYIDERKEKEIQLN